MTGTKSRSWILFYYPLKTIDSVPRFKYAILSLLNEWVIDEEILASIVDQGIRRRVFSDEETGRQETMAMITSIADTYESIEGMIADIDRKHVEYTNASIDRIRYQMNADRSAKGKLIALLKHFGEEEVSPLWFRESRCTATVIWTRSPFMTG